MSSDATMSGEASMSSDALSARPAKKSPAIAVVGSVNLDFVVRTETLPIAGETVGGGEFFTTPGGKGANQALAAHRLGGRAQMLACVGNDTYADEALANLKQDGVDLSGVTRLPDVKTGAAFINVDDAGENQIAVAAGANYAFTPVHLPAIKADAIIAQLEVASETIAAAALQGDAFFTLNAAPAQPLGDDIIQRADLIIVNEIEQAYYADKLKGFSGLLALTLGAKGAVLFDKGAEIARAGAPKVDAIDTTGAGDCFVGALTVALMEGFAPQEALQRACISGALATTRLGAQAATPTRQEVDAFIDNMA